MNVFGSVSGDDALRLTMERYPDVPGEEQGLLAAGHMMAGVFRTIDWIQLVVIPVVVLSLLLHFFVLRGEGRWRLLHLVRAGCVVGAAGIYGFHAAAISPVMNDALEGRWAALEAGDMEKAEELRAKFGELHPRADMLLRVNLFLLLGAVGATGGLMAGDSNTRKIES